MTTNSSSNIPTGASNTVLMGQGVGVNSSFSTATYPPTTTINQILYSSSANVIVGLSTANNGLLITSAAGIPSILAAPATTGQILQSNAAGPVTFSTASYPSTTTINQILYSSAANTVTGLATTNKAVLTTGATGVPVLTALTDGQLIIGSTAGAPAAATLAGGTGISVTNAGNSITIATTGAGFTWNNVTTGIVTLAVENGYITNNGPGVTYTLPATANLGDTIKIVGKAGASTIAQNASQQITFGSSSTTSGILGSLVATNIGDCVEMVCVTSGASTVWRVTSSMGNWTIA